MSELPKTEPEDLLAADADAEDIRRMAVSYVEEAFAAADYDGIDADAVAHAALFTAFRELVETYGEEATAVFAEALPAKIKSGAYTICTRH